MACLIELIQALVSDGKQQLRACARLLVFRLPQRGDCVGIAARPQVQVAQEKQVARSPRVCADDLFQQALGFVVAAHKAVGLR